MKLANDSSRRRTSAIILLGFSAVLVLAAVVFARHDGFSRSIGCQAQGGERARAICSSLERHLELTCCGHAIFSPGFRATWTTVTAVWCEQQIQAQDEAVLRALAKAEDDRLRAGAESLLRLLLGHDQDGAPEDETSIFNPANPGYLLKSGCTNSSRHASSCCRASSVG